MNKHITFSILTAGLFFLTGCDSDSTTANIYKGDQVAQQSFGILDTKGDLNTTTTNHTPVACSKTYCTNKDTNLTAQLIAKDEDNDTLTYAISDLNTSKGIIDLNTSSGIFNYAPATGFVGKYTFKFTATDEHNATSEAKEVTLIVKDTTPDLLVAPVAPTNLEATETTTTTTKLTWEDNSDNEKKFVIYKDGKAIKCVKANTTSQVIDGLEEGHSYKFTVIAKNSAGSSASSNEVEVTTQTSTVAPDAPSDVKIIAKNSKCVRLKWVDNSDNESGFRIYNQDGELIKTVVANRKCTAISGLEPETEYTFKVVAFNSAGESDASEVTVITDAKPANHAPVAHNKRYSTYKDTNLTSKLCASDADGDVLTYKIEEEPFHGSVELNTTSGVFTYVPENGYIGDDEFTFSVSDETNSSEIKKAIIKICDN